MGKSSSDEGAKAAKAGMCACGICCALCIGIPLLIIIIMIIIIVVAVGSAADSIADCAESGDCGTVTYSGSLSSSSSGSNVICGKTQPDTCQTAFDCNGWTNTLCTTNVCV